MKEVLNVLLADPEFVKIVFGPAALFLTFGGMSWIFARRGRIRPRT